MGGYAPNESFWITEAMCVVMRWENIVVGPRFTLT